VDRHAATEQELFLCHTPEYLRTAKHDVLAGRPYLSTGDTDIRPNSWDVAPQAAGGVLNAVDAAEFPGWIPREDLHDLFARAWAFLCPSRFEGFGLPLLEALASGIPTACSKIEPLSSITAGAAGRGEWRRRTPSLFCSRKRVRS
jgi:glycosyltransferase involved in cell wall biosynthesis